MKYSIDYKFHSLWLLAGLLLIHGQLMAQQSSRLVSTDELFQLGIENSLRIKASKMQEIMMDDQQKTALTGRLPNLQIGINAAYSGNPLVFEQGLSHPVSPNVPNWSQNYSITLNQTIYQGGKIQYSIRKADIEKQIAAIATTNDMGEVKLFLLQEYMTLLNYYKQRDVLSRNIEESQRRLQDIKRMKKEGILTRNDEIRSELQLTNDQLAHQETTNSITIASQELDILLGLDESLLIVPDTSVLYRNFELDNYESYVELAYDNYPGMKIASRNIEIAENDTKITRANYLPSIALLAGNTLARPLTNPLEDRYNNKWNIGLSLSYNLSSIYQNRHQVHQAQQMVELRRNAQEQLKQNIRIQIRSAYIRHQESINRVQALELSVSQASENYRIVHNRYLNQLSILTDLLDASNVRLAAELQLATARAQTIYTYYELQRACGNL
ncbi:MAG: TolC family protein [Mucinivorans sp.]